MSVENSLIRKQVFNQRFINGLAKQYNKELERVYSRVVARMAQEPNNTRLQAIAGDLNAIMNNGLNDVAAKMEGDILDFAEDEADFLGKVMELNSKAPLRLPDAGALRRALARNDLDVLTGGNTLTVGEIIDKFSVSQKASVRRILTDGVLMGDTVQDMTKSIMQLSKTRTRAQAEALTRTLTNYASSQARKAFVTTNQAVFDGEEWVSVLDSRTTLICSGRDGNVYPIGKGPYPPAHYNCRSVRIPVLKKDFEAVNQKSNRENFDVWLKGQDSEFQQEYFSQFSDGDDKFKLFKKGKLELQEFRDETGKVYTLEELRALYPKAFRDAGITLEEG